MNNVKTDHIHVPGAQISYSTRGSGPLLLLIAGGEGSGDGYDHMAGILSDRYTVVTYAQRAHPVARQKIQTRSCAWRPTAMTPITCRLL